MSKSMMVYVDPPVMPYVESGLDRGGILEADWVPRRYVGADYRPVPVMQVPHRIVPQAITRMPVAFSPTEQIRALKGLGTMMVRADPRPRPVGPSTLVTGPRGSQEGGIFAGMGAEMVRADMAPQPVRMYKPVRAQDSGIFGMHGFGAPSPDGIGGFGRAPSRSMRSRRGGRPRPLSGCMGACGCGSCR